MFYEKSLFSVIDIVGGCADGKWSCHDGRRCIREKYVCDGKFHCTDGSDERSDICIIWHCPVGTWKCSNDRCIGDTLVCDREENCGDGSDEEDKLCSEWKCPLGRWKCDNNICISENLVCDGKGGCTDRSDENPDLCYNWICSSGMWKCNDGLQCILERYVCDGRSLWTGCKDGSDEAQCKNHICPEGTWQCKDGNGCVQNEFVCCTMILSVIRTDCIDRSDDQKEVCMNWTCSPGLWKCHDKARCIEESDILDGISHCLDGSDEDPQYHVGRTCSHMYHLCDDNSQCLQNSFWCDGRSISDGEDYYGCKDGSDEGLHCQSWECHPAYWKCANGLQCIDADFVCDGRSIANGKIYGCQDKSDEHNQLCGSCISDNEWSCHDGDGCLHLSMVCDGDVDCSDKSDENENACISWNCSQNMWKCNDQKRCVFKTALCDGKVHCLDSSDEEDCIHQMCMYNSTKCADKIQCVYVNSICNGNIDCLDGSDKLCMASCLQTPIYYNTIIRRCIEDRRVCVPVERYCDRVADCPLGSDEAESGCSCDDWKLTTCEIEGINLCIYAEWIGYQEQNIDEHSIKMCSKGRIDYALKNYSLALIQRNITVHVTHTSFANASMIFKANISNVLLISFHKVIFMNSSIIAQNAILIFTNCSFDWVNIEDVHYFDPTEVENLNVDLIGCTFLGEVATYGIRFHSGSVLNIFILESTLQSSIIDIFAKNIILTVSKSALVYVVMNIKVKSYIQVPSILHFEHSSFIQEKDSGKHGKGSAITLILFNPYVRVTSCTFSKTSLDILSEGYDFHERLFLVEIKDTLFTRAAKTGNGGALKIFSTVQNTSVTIMHSTFIENKAFTVSNDEPGKGGAVFVDGDSVLLEIEGCVFLNNSADYTGAALYTSSKVIASVRNSSFTTNFASGGFKPVFSFRGKVEYLFSHVHLISVLPIHSKVGFEIFEFGHLLNDMSISLNCPVWYRHVVTLFRRFLYSVSSA